MDGGGWRWMAASLLGGTRGYANGRRMAKLDSPLFCSPWWPEENRSLSWAICLRASSASFSRSVWLAI